MACILSKLIKLLWVANWKLKRKGVLQVGDGMVTNGSRAVLFLELSIRCPVPMQHKPADLLVMNYFLLLLVAAVMMFVRPNLAQTTPSAGPAQTANSQRPKSFSVQV